MLLVLSGSCGPLLAATVADSTTIVCPQVTFPPTLEGRLDDWPALPQAVLATAEDWRPAAPQYAEYGGPDDVSGEVWLAWDSSALYLGLQVRDNALVRPRSIASIDHGDSVVLSFGGAQSASRPAGEPQVVNEFVVALLRSGYPVFRAKPADRAGELRSVSVGIDAPEEGGGVRRVVYELGIPWSELAPLRPASGVRFTLNVSLCDDDGAGLEGCQERALPVLLSAVGEVVRPSPGEGPRVPALQPVFPAPEVARFDRNCFVIRGQDALLLGGEVEYASIPSADWPARVTALKATGMNLVAVTVPWSHHQPTSQAADLSALRDFLSLCAREGLLVQLNAGPYAGEQWAGGGVPDWVLDLPSAEQKNAAIESWCGNVFAVAKEQQLNSGGPVAVIVIRPLPDRRGRVDAASLERLLALASQSGISVPLVTANAPAARNNSRQTLANLLDTLAFYSAPSPDELAAGLRGLARIENGPACVTTLSGNYSGAAAARRSSDLVKLALASGASGVVLGDFAPGLRATTPVSPDGEAAVGVVDASGARTAGYDEVRLIGTFLSQAGASLARAPLQDGAVEVDQPEVAASLRSGGSSRFLFVWDKGGTVSHSVRLTVSDPLTGARSLVPEAGAIALPPGGVKMLAANLPVGRGLLRYSTSEVLGVYPAGERTLLVVYGDTDTAGEVALQWPGPPLVTGDVTRQRWDADTRTLVLDYYHAADDRYLLVDDLQIAILSRARAARAAALPTAQGAVFLSAEAAVQNSGEGSRLLATLNCPAGTVAVTAAVPAKPSAVLLDGKPVGFEFTTPERVLSLSVATPSFEQEHRATTVWERLGRAVVGGPPRLTAQFDRAWFMPDDPRGGNWKAVEDPGKELEQLGIAAGSFIRLRSRFDPGGRPRMVLKGSRDPALVFCNGEFISDLSGSAAERQADLSGILVQGVNEVVIVLHLLPRTPGAGGILAGPRGLPAVVVVGDGEPLSLTTWEMSTGLAGELAGWNRQDHNTSDWHFIRFGPWRRQGRELARAAGLGWYRVPFGLPEPGKWQVPYRVTIDLTGAAVLWLNGRPLATCVGDGRYSIPIPQALVRPGENMLAAIVYGADEATGLRRVEVAADEARMTRATTLEVRF
jgi:hypothetical protein